MAAVEVAECAAVAPSVPPGNVSLLRATARNAGATGVAKAVGNAMSLATLSVEMMDCAHAHLTVWALNADQMVVAEAVGSVVPQTPARMAHASLGRMSIGRIRRLGCNGNCRPGT